MSNFKVGDKIRWKDTPSSDQGEIIWVGEVGGMIVCWDSQPLEEFHYTHKAAEQFEKAQKPANRPKYALVEAKKDEFLQQVNELIAQGYKPQGGVAVDQQYCIQAMILEN